jgi:geranylgeranyl diphosphate synthase, type II
MHSFEELSKEFSQLFSIRHFPEQPSSLYDPAEYFLGMGGKRIRPVLCLMGNELFDTINPDAYAVATSIELFHNFTLIHDDIMDRAPLRRGLQTVHEKYGQPTALLAGDVMLVVAYDQLNRIKSNYIHKVIHLFNKTAKQVCEGQQWDMDFEKQETVQLPEYLKMIELKTSVLLAASLQLGAILGGAQEGNQKHLYEFGKNLGMAFQVQDDYLDAFGDPEKFGKQVGGDIMSNKKTFLMIHAMEAGSESQVNDLKLLGKEDSPGKVDKVLEIFKQCGVDRWAFDLKEKYITEALKHLDEIAVLSSRKKPLVELTHLLVQREY